MRRTACLSLAGLLLAFTLTSCPAADPAPSPVTTGTEHHPWP
ncbi:hypothetical protein [Streptomyces cinereoruber]